MGLLPFMPKPVAGPSEVPGALPYLN
ncbi:MAG: hypothetical protein RL230_3053, partial [Pseudomonadota bacterium]